MSTKSGGIDIGRKFLNLVPVEENSYKSDIQLLDRYQAYSAELLRLSLAGLGVVGFLVTNKLVTERPVKICLMIGIILFGVSSGAALGHRYFSSDGIHHLLKAIRLSSRIDPDESQIEHEGDLMKAKYKRSWTYLRIACVSLALGALAVSMGFVIAALL
jgi:hypothetical protein